MDGWVPWHYCARDGSSAAGVAPQLLDNLEELLDTNLRILRLVFMLAKLMFIAHALGCFWYNVAASTPPGEPNCEDALPPA